MNSLDEESGLFLDEGLKGIVGFIRRQNDKNELLQYAKQNAEAMDAESINLALVLTGTDKLIKYYQNNFGKKGAPMWKAIEDLINDSKEEGGEESAKLMNFLWRNGHRTEAEKAENDTAYRNELLEKYKNGTLVLS